MNNNCDEKSLNSNSSKTSKELKTETYNAVLSGAGIQSIDIGTTIVGIQKVDTGSESMPHNVWLEKSKIYCDKGENEGSLELAITYLHY